MAVKTTLQKITDKAKVIRKAHPKMKWTDAIKTASKEISGVKVIVKRKSATKTKAKPKRVAAVKVAGVPAKKSAPKRKISGVAIPQVNQGLAILKNIDVLEAKRTAARGKDAKDFIQYAINAEHQKLKSLERTLKNVR
jgi:DNA-directed RNA polymerase subunit H (RpoH/RPB5)